MKHGTITIVSGEDWKGVYKNGRLITEGHTINIGELISVLGFGGPAYISVDQAWLEQNGLPKNLRDLPKEKME